MNTNSILRAKEPSLKVECLQDEDTKKLLEYFRNREYKNKKELVRNKRDYCMCWLLIYT